MLADMGPTCREIAIGGPDYRRQNRLEPFQCAALTCAVHDPNVTQMRRKHHDAQAKPLISQAHRPRNHQITIWWRLPADSVARYWCACTTNLRSVAAVQRTQNR